MTYLLVAVVVAGQMRLLRVELKPERVLLLLLNPDRVEVELDRSECGSDVASPAAEQ